jgi:hypothetical protein
MTKIIPVAKTTSRQPEYGKNGTPFSFSIFSYQER